MALSVGRFKLKPVISSTSSSWLRCLCSNYLRSWEPTNNPREAQARLARIRKQYKLQVSELRQQYYNELETQRLEEKAKTEAKRERIMAAKRERKAAKKEESQLLAVDREKQQEEFREMLRQERAQKAERRMKKEHFIAQRISQEKELIRQKSSQWIDENELDRKIMEAFVDTTLL